MTKVLVIEGPTAVGKTAFSLDLAEKFNAEIISGDSVQVYRGFDIGSGKLPLKDRRGIPHHLIDIKEYYEDYNITSFQKDVRYLIDDITKRNKRVMIVGGSGLYLKSALYDYEFKEESAKDLAFEELSNEDLYNKLMEVDPKALDKIHINNRRRLLRAYNYYLKNNEPISNSVERQEHKPLYDVLFIGLTIDREKLYESINSRVDEMIDEGLEDEIKDLLAKGCDFSYKPMGAIGYAQWEEYFIGEKTKDEVIHDIKKATRNFAKRQYTWFNRQTPITWYRKDELNKAIDDIGDWFNE